MGDIDKRVATVNPTEMEAALRPRRWRDNPPFGFPSSQCNRTLSLRTAVPTTGGLIMSLRFPLAMACAISFSVLPQQSVAQVWPPPVDLQIQNIPQQTPVWCWAAVAQQIILRLQGPDATPSQCELVAIANGAAPTLCCYYPVQCAVTGSLPQIQGLIAQFGGSYSSLEPPTDPMTLYNTLASGRAVILALQSPVVNTGHVVVLRGMEWTPTAYGPQPVLYVNDPMSYFTQPVPYTRIVQMWSAAIVVY